MSVNVSITPTPNPNSMKITVDRTVIDKGSKTFDSAAEASSNPLASALFNIGGVASVFMLNNFITVTKASDADWKAMLPELERIVRGHFG
jgi:hypothetical protein